MTAPRVLAEATEAVTGARNADYGDPWDNHQRTADAWSWWLRNRPAVPLSPIDVCALNILQKLSRLAHSPDHRDSVVDIAGYAANWGSILDGRKS